MNRLKLPKAAALCLSALLAACQQRMSFEDAEKFQRLCTAAGGQFVSSMAPDGTINYAHCEHRKGST